MLMQQEKQVYSVEEAADVLEVHPDTIRRMIKRHELKVSRVGRQIRIPRSEIDRLLAGELPTDDSQS